jgi:hypothetical protein
LGGAAVVDVLEVVGVVGAVAVLDVVCVLVVIAAPTVLLACFDPPHPAIASTAINTPES